MCAISPKSDHSANGAQRTRQRTRPDARCACGSEGWGVGRGGGRMESGQSRRAPRRRRYGVGACCLWASTIRFPHSSLLTPHSAPKAPLMRLELLNAMLAAYTDRWQDLADLAEQVKERVAVPTGPLDERLPAPDALKTYTALATDGAEIDPDRHGGSGDFFLINVGRVRSPYGQPHREVELRSVSSLGFTEEDLFIVDPRDPRRQVPMRDRHLDALRTVEEVKALADLAESESATGAGPAVALVDGTLLFSVLEE